MLTHEPAYKLNSRQEALSAVAERLRDVSCLQQYNTSSAVFYFQLLRLHISQRGQLKILLCPSAYQSKVAVIQKIHSAWPFVEWRSTRQTHATAMCCNLRPNPPSKCWRHSTLHGRRCESQVYSYWSTISIFCRIVITLGVEKLEWCGYPTVRIFWRLLSRFDRIDEQTDTARRHRPRLCIASR